MEKVISNTPGNRFSIFSNVKSDRDYSSTTGLTKNQFETLSQKFATWYKPTLTIDWPQGFGKDSIFQNPAEALFFLLYHHKVGVTFDVLAINFGMARATAYSAIMRLKPILKTGLTDEGDLPRRVFSSKEDMESYRSGDPV